MNVKKILVCQMIGPAAAGSAGPVLTPVFLTDRAIASSSAAAQLRRWINVLSFFSSLLPFPFCSILVTFPPFSLIFFLITHRHHSPFALSYFSFQRCSHFLQSSDFICTYSYITVGLVDGRHRRLKHDHSSCPFCRLCVLS